MLWGALWDPVWQRSSSLTAGSLWDLPASPSDLLIGLQAKKLGLTTVLIAGKTALEEQGSTARCGCKAHTVMPISCHEHMHGVQLRSGRHHAGLGAHAGQLLCEHGQELCSALAPVAAESQARRLASSMERPKGTLSHKRSKLAPACTAAACQNKLNMTYTGGCPAAARWTRSCAQRQSMQ